MKAWWVTGLVTLVFSIWCWFSISLVSSSGEVKKLDCSSSDILEGCSGKYVADFISQLHRRAPPDIARMAERFQVSPAWVSLSLLPSMAKHHEQFCAIHSTEEICDTVKRKKVDAHLDFLLADMIRNANDMSILRAVNYGCAFPGRAMNMAEHLREAENHKAKVARQMLLGCGLPVEQAWQTIRQNITVDSPLLAISILELYRLGDPQLDDYLQNIYASLPDGLEKVLSDYVQDAD